MVRQSLCERAHEKGQESQLGLISALAGIQFPAQTFQLRQIAFFDVCDVRDRALGGLHPLRNLAPQPDNGKLDHSRHLPLAAFCMVAGAPGIKVCIEIVCRYLAGWPGAWHELQRDPQIVSTTSGGW
jgi:hypothetical protein